MTQHDHCAQMPRIVHLEAAISGISDTLKDVKDLLKSSIQANERILALQRESLDQERRLRKIETGHAAMRWTERVAWAVVAAGLGLVLKGLP